MVSSMSRLLSMAAELAEVWTRFYTLGMPQTAQQRRRREIASDVWECLAEVSLGKRRSRDGAVEILAVGEMPGQAAGRWSSGCPTSSRRTPRSSAAARDPISMRTAQARLDTAQAQLRMAEDQVSRTDLRVDAAGVVTAAPVEPGEVVQAGQMIVRVARQDGDAG